MKARRAVVGLALLVTCVAVSAQTPHRAMQMGVKTTGAGWAIMAPVTLFTDNLSAASGTMQEAFMKLWTEALAVGLTPLGPGHVVMMTMPTGPPEGGEFSFEVQLPIIEEPTDADFDRAEQAVIVPIEARKVAFTYHKGAGEDPQAVFTALSGSFTRLYEWLMAKGHEPAAPPRVIAYGVDRTGAFQAAELQVPIE